MRIPLIVLPLLVSTASLAQHPLANLQNRSRILLVFGMNSQNDQIRTQLASLDGKAMAERDLVLVCELEQWQKNDEDLFISRNALNSNAEQLYTRRRFRIPSNAFTILLLGKDGGEKLRSSTPVTMQQLNQLIDAMPMRQQEMKPRPPQ